MTAIEGRPAPLQPVPAPPGASPPSPRRREGRGQAAGRCTGGGCSGFQYLFALDDKSEDGDIVIERDGAAVVVDGMSLMYVIGSELDFVEDLTGSYFKVKNLNASFTCGCGTSFAI